MKKKTIIISSIAGILISGLCVKFAANSRHVPVIENAAGEERAASDELNEQVRQEAAEPESPGQAEKPERMEPGTG